MKVVYSSGLRFLLFCFVIGLVLCSANNVSAEFIFGTPTNLGPMVNSSYNEYDLGITADGLTLYFSSDRPGGFGVFDIWVTTRATASDEWQQPVNLGQAVNGPYYDIDPRLSMDGLELFFSSDRPGGFGSFDIWVTRRPKKNDPWGAPVNLGASVNSSALESNLSILANSLSLFFSEDSQGSFRPNGYGLGDIWVTKRTTSDAWGDPLNLGPTVNSSYEDYDPSISNDGTCLFFNSIRPGGLGDFDLWQTLIKPLVDFNSDGIINLKDFSKLAQYWLQNESSVDIAPAPLGDGKVDFKDLEVLSEHWLQKYEEIVYTIPLGGNCWHTN